MAFALAQIGKPYVFAASGPNAYDCSGLTMAAWGKAGVQLPHFAAYQYNMGHHVSRSQLEPGDLVFFYPGIQHVAMYIGQRHGRPCPAYRRRRSDRPAVRVRWRVHRGNPAVVTSTASSRPRADRNNGLHAPH